ncbi:MAG: PEP-CTERM sorting domain-containing protein [Nostoc indistinguendum CM1-VF10]|nr:PEP-CTERM sorting domain-containing protein [Nostoc indistinguendum CM1-VF10]
MTGTFYNATGELAIGDGSITAQKQNSGKVGSYSYSITANSITKTVPEPAALLGLGAVGAVMAMSSRRKNFAQ